MGDAAPDGSAWIGPDGEHYARNPRRLVSGELQCMVDLWLLYRGGGLGGGLMPDPGGTFDQAAVMLEAFALMSAAATEFQPKGGH